MIIKVNIYDLRLPLKIPYYSALGELNEFATLIVQMQDDKSQEGYGETTTTSVPGYCWEGPEDVWSFALKKGPEVLGKTIIEAWNLLTTNQRSWPFSVTAWFTALEDLKKEPLFNPPEKDTLVPLVGIVNTTKTEDIPASVEDALTRGYKTVKVKVGIEVEEDIRKVKTVQNANANRALIRIDANQGYTFDQAVHFVNSINPEGVELFEQPFEKNAWGAMGELMGLTRLPLMLDESIYHLEEIERSARENCAHFLKLKLMKAGSARTFKTYIERTKELGMKVVMGNGVATDLGCYHEALVATNLDIKTAGEENGFLKLKDSFVTGPLKFRDGAIILEPNLKVTPNRDKLESFCFRHRSWEA